MDLEKLLPVIFNLLDKAEFMNNDDAIQANELLNNIAQNKGWKRRQRYQLKVIPQVKK